MNEKIQIKILEQQVRDLKNKLFEKDFVSPRGHSKILASFDGEILEIVQIEGGGNGWTISFNENGSCSLFEITPMQFFVGEFQNVYDALLVAKSWT